MVSIVSGNSLGVSLTSLNTLGQLAVGGNLAQGRNGQAVYVNAATGNLVLQDKDLSQSERGNQQIDSVRTYNSLGSLGPDDWSKGFDTQALKLTTGTVNTAGSVVTRVGADGSSQAYTYNTTTLVYTSTGGGGARDTIAYNATTHVYTRTDGASQMVETYTSTGVLSSTTDSDGNTVTYTHNAAGYVTSVTDPAGATLTTYAYDASNRLTSIQTKDLSNNQSTWVYYAYDTSNRLSTVTLDLTPADNAVTDAKTYVTHYTYVAATAQLSTITQSDGTSITLTYDTSLRVATITDQAGNQTKFAYDTTNRNTTVTDPNGVNTVYNYDTLGQLKSITAPTTGTATATTSYTYDTNGNVTQVTDGAGRTVTMTYDANGNQTQQQDGAGNTVARTYDALDHLVTETAYVVPDPDGAGTGTATVPMTTRYVYDPAGQHLLRFVLTPEGRVTEYRYDAVGNRTADIQYGASVYALSGMAVNAAPTLAQMTTWIGTQDLTHTTRTDVVYDAFGQLTTSTAWGKVDATGAGVSDTTQSVTHYVYNQFGQLLNTVSPLSGTTTYTYDGMGRVMSVANAAGSTTTSYDDAHNKTTLTYANGLAVTSAYDSAGRLTSVVQGTSTTPTMGTALYAYDADGNLRMTTAADGVRAYMLYDAGGRKIADIDANGTLVESVYNNDGQVVETIQYANALSAAQLASLVDTNGKPTNVALSTLRPTGATYASWTLYDAAGRVSKQVDASNYVTETRYDGASRVTDVIRYANATATAITASSLPADIVVTASATGDRHTRVFYDNDGLVTGTLDAAGYLTENVYDALGNLVHTIAYATITPSTYWATGTLAQLRPALDATHDIHTWNYYDAQDRLVGSVDGEGYLTETGYDADGNAVRTLRYATKALVAPQTITATTTLAQLRPTTTAQDHTTTAVFNTLHQVTSSTDEHGTITQYAYDNVGHLLATTTAATTTDARTVTDTYDVQGRLTGELDGRGSAALAALGATPTAVQIASVWASYGTTYTYDASGLRTSMTDAAGNKTTYFYNADGLQTYVVNALGEVTQTRYDARDLVSATVRYGTRIATTGLVGGADSQVSSLVTAVASATLDSTTTHTYDARREILQQTGPTALVDSQAYDAFGDVVSATTGLGAGATVTETTKFDQRGQAVGTVADSGGIAATTTEVRDAFGRVTSVTDVNGNVTTATFDRLGRTVQASDNLATGRVNTSASYDAFGRTLTTVDGTAHTTTYTWNDASLTLAVRAPSGATVVTTFDRHGETINVRNGDGKATTTQYDLDGDVAHTIVDSDTGGLLLDTHTDYDTADRVADTVDANGVKTVYTYDNANRVLTRTVDSASLALRTTYVFDAKGEVITQTDPYGLVTAIKYDLAGGVLSRTIDPNGLKLATSFTYDGRGDVLTQTDPSGTITTYVYDKLGRRTSMTVDSASGGLALKTSYAYDKAGNLTQVTDPAGAVTRYVYDGDNRVHYTLDAENGLTETDYDANGRVTQQIVYATRQLATVMTTTTASNGIVTNAMGAITTGATDTTTLSAYDVDGRKVSVRVDPNGLNLTTQYAYDNAGNVTRVIDPDGNVTRKVYDAANRPVYTIDPTGVVTQTAYDADGRVKTVTTYATAPTTINTVVASNGTVTTTVSGVTTSPSDKITQSTYDNAGRQLTSTVIDAAASFTTSYAYDPGGNLTRMTDPDGKVTLYAYDRAGRQTFKLDPVGHLTETAYDAVGRVTMQVVYGDVQTSTITTLSSASGMVVTSVGTIVTDTALDQYSRYVYDKAGRQVYAIDALGNVTQNQYDAAGRLVVQRHYAQPIALPTVGSTDGKTLTVNGDTAQLTGSTYYALDTTHNYTVTVRARQLSGTGAMYAGVITKDASGNILTNVSGNGGTYSYCAGWQTITPDMGWVTFTGSITGTYTPTLSTPNNYNAFIAGSTTVSPLVLYNFNATTNSDPGRDVEIDSITLYDNTTGTTVNIDPNLANGAANLTDTRGAVETASTSLRTTLTAAQVAARLRVSPNDQVLRYAYDKDGRQVFAVDGAGTTTETDYDGAGNIVNKTVYASPIALPTAGSTDGKTITVNGNTAQVTGSAYYALNTAHNYTVTVRARQLSGTGTFYAGVITKDASGNVLTNFPGNGGTYSYCAGYQTLTPDMGWTTFTGTITGTTTPSASTPVNYNTFIAGSATVSPLVLYNYNGTNGDPGRDVEIDSISIYDNTAGVSVTPDTNLANGAASVAATGGAVETVASTVDAALTADQIRARLRVNPATDRTTRYAYDAAGRPVFSVDPTGQVSETTYDADGNVATTRAYANLITLPTDHTAALSVSAIRAALTASATADRVTRYVYDADGRQVLAVAPDGTATQTTYDNFGNVTLTRQLATPVPAGNALQLNYVAGTDSSAQDALGTFAAGDTVTVTVRMYAPLGSTGKMWLSNGGTDQVSTPLITGTGGWVTLTLTHTMATASAMFVHLYGDRDGPHATAGTFAQYADLRVSSTQRGAVIADNFTAITTGTAQGQWQFVGSPQLTVAAPLALADSDADLLTLVGSLANAATDRVTRNVYDEAGRRVLTVDPAGQATQTTYDAAGNITQTRLLATPVPTGAGLRVNYVAGTNSSAGFLVGHFAVGDTVTATIRFRAPPSGTHDIGGRIYVGDGTNPGSYSAQTTVTNGWQTLTTSFTVTATNTGDVYVLVYGNRDGAAPQAGDYVVYDDLVVTSQQKGLVYNSPFDNLNPGTGVGQWRVDANEYQVYATPADAGTDAQLLAYVNASADNTRDRVTRDFYDAEGRQVYEVDGRGYVTETRYFANHTQTIRYATAPALGATPTTASIATALAGIANEVSDQYFDADGNATDLINPAGITSRDIHDGLGRVVTHIDALGKPEQTTTGYTYDAAGRVLTETVAQGTTAAATTVNTYDAYGDLLTQVSPEGYALANGDSAWAQATRVTKGYPAASASLSAAQKTTLMALYTTRYAYDLDGRTTTTTNALGATSTTTYDAFGDAVKVVDPLGNAGYFWFDTLGRVTLQADPLGNLTQTVYTPGFGDKVASIRRYAIPATAGTYSVATPPTPTANAKDAVTSYTYDADGRVLSTTDGAGTESVTYHAALGNSYDVFDKVVTNKAGGSSTYLYDQDGNETSETLPVVNAGGVAVSNTYVYDGYGNRIQSIEGVNLATGLALPEARTTQYRYDAMNRVIARVGTAYVAADGSTVTPIDTTAYDALGRVIETRTNASASTADGGKTYTATGGARTLNYYDAAGNQVMTVAADGAVVAQSFTASGKVFKNSAYATGLSASVVSSLVAGGTQPGVTAAPATDRVTTYAYDALDRLVTTSLDNVVTWQQVFTADQLANHNNDINVNGAGLAMAHTQTMQTLVYDANGNVVQQVDARGNSTYNYYDAAGRKVLAIDPDGYVTAWDYNNVSINGTTVWNSFDSPLQQVQYAAQMAAGSWARQGDTSVANANLRTPAALRAAVAALALPTNTPNRTTQFVRDTAGRVTEQRVLGTAYAYVDGNGTTTQGTADAVTDTQYDGLGDITQTLQQVGAGNTVTTNYSYDALGRKTRELDPSYTDYNGVVVSPETDTVYDALGNTASTTQVGSGASGGPVNRATTYTYDANGNLRTQTDAAGNVTTYTLDAMGRIARTSVQGIAVLQPVYNADNSIAFNADGTNKTQMVAPAAVVTTYTYDAMGRQASQTDVASGQIQFTKYDVFGDVTDKGTGSAATGVVYQEHTTYNVLGKVESSTTGDGAIKFYVYDANGNTTRQISSNSVNLNGATIAQLIDPSNAGYIGSSLAQTFSLYDARNNLKQTVEAKSSFQTDAASESAAYTESQVTPYSGMGMVAPGSSQAVGGGSNPQNVAVSSTSGTTLPTSNGMTVSGNVAMTGPYNTSAPGGIAATTFPMAGTIVNNGTHQDCGLWFIPANFPAGTYRVVTGAAPGTVRVAAAAKAAGVAGATVMVYASYGAHYLQIQVGSQWVTVGTLTNTRTTLPGGENPSFNESTALTNSVGMLLTGVAGPLVVAYTNFGTPSQQSLTVTAAPAYGGGNAPNAYVVNAPAGSGPVTVLSLTLDGTLQYAATYPASVSAAGVSLGTAQSLPAADAWVSYPSSTTPAIVFNGNAAGGSGGTFYYRPANTTGPWTPITMATNAVGLPTTLNGTYDFRRFLSTNIDQRGQFSMSGGVLTLVTPLVTVATEQTQGLSLDISRVATISPTPSQYTLILKVFQGSSQLFTDTQTINGAPGSYTLPAGDMAYLNSTAWQDSSYTYSYDVYANVGGAAAQYVGNGSGGFTLGSDSAVTANNTPSFAQPIGIVNLPADVPLGGTVTLSNGSGTLINGTLGSDWRITTGAPSGTTPLVFDLSQWLATNGTQPASTAFSFSYTTGLKTVTGTLTMSSNGTVSASNIWEVTKQPQISLSLPGTSKIVISYGSGQGTTIMGSSGIWSVAGIATTSSQNFSYQGYDAANNVISSGTGSFYLNGSGDLVASNKPSPTLVFSSIPSGASNPLGTQSFIVTGIPNNTTLLDGSTWLLTPTTILADGTYSLRYTGTDSEGFVTTSGTVTLTVTNGVGNYSAPVPDQQPLYLTGPAGYNVPGAKMQISLPSGPVMLTGVWSARHNAMMFSWIPSGIATGIPLAMTMSFLKPDGTLYSNQFGSTFVMNGTITLGAVATTPPVLTQTVQHVAGGDEVSHYQSSNAFGQVARQWDDNTAANATMVATDFGESANLANVVTNLYYDTRGDLIEKDDPETSVTDIHGVRTRVQPKTMYGYDLLGRLTLSVDANGIATRQSYAGGTEQGSIRWNPSHWDSSASAWAYEGKTRTDYDILGALRRTTIDITDASHQEIINQDTDILGNVVRVSQLGVTRAASFTGSQAAYNFSSTVVDNYSYDAFGRRIAHQNDYGWYDFTLYDSLGRVKQTVSEQGRETNYTYQFVAPTAGFFVGSNGQSTGGWRLTTSNADGTSTVDDTNYFNQTTRHVDEGGDVAVFTYNFDAHLVTQTTTLSAQHATDSHVSTALLKYTYADNGDILTVLDTGANTLSEYGYDNSGNRTSEIYGSIGGDGKMLKVAEAATIEYDESNRIHRVLDNGVDVSYEYDAVGNRRRVQALYNDLGGGIRQQDDFWYTYDDANRFTTTMGSLDHVGGSIIRGNDGVIITYDLRGDRMTAIDAQSSATPGAMESYTYTVDGYLQTVTVNGQLANTRVDDALGRTLDNVTYSYTNGVQAAHHQTSNYDRDNRMQSQTDETGTTNYLYFNSTYVEGAGSQAAASTTGNGQLASVSNGSTTTSYTYTLWDSADQLSIKVAAGSTTNTTNESYNAEGFLVKAESGQYGQSDYASTVYTLSSSGLVMTRQQYTGVNATLTDNHYYYYAGGHTIGDVSDSTNPDSSRMSYAEQWATVTKQGVLDTSKYKTNQPVEASDFDQSYQPINQAYPAATPSTYTVHNGDTLRSIARALWGDADMWYLIAQANNLSASTSLVSGQILTIPNKVTNIHNNGDTFRPYDPSDAIGHIDPTLPPPPAPSGSKGCGTIGTIIMVVVAVVVTIYTAGAAAELLGAAMTTAGATGAAAIGGAAVAGGGLVAGAGGFVLGSAAATAMAAAAIGGAVGSIAAQAVGDLMGNTKGFSWKQVATAAVGSMITAGVGEAMAPAATAAMPTTAAAANSGGLSSLTWAGVGHAMEAATASTAIQEALKGEWNWRNIAASAVGAAAGEAAGAAMTSAVGNSNQFDVFAQRLSSGVGNGWAQQQVLATDPRYTRARTSSLFADSIGNAIAQGLADEAVMQNLPPAIRNMSFNAQRQALALSQQYSMNLEDPRDAADLTDMVRMLNEPAGTVSDQRRAELTDNGLKRLGLTDDQRAEVMDMARASGALPPKPADPTPAPPPPDGVQLQTVEIDAKRSQAAPVLTSNDIDQLAIHTGDFIEDVGQKIHDHPWLGAGITTLSIMAAPVSYAANKAFELSPLGDAIKAAEEKVQSLISDRFTELGYQPDRAAAGGVGTMAVLGAVAGWGTTKVLSMASGAFASLRKKFNPPQVFTKISDFVRETNDPMINTKYLLNGIGWKTDRFARLESVEGPVKFNPAGRDKTLQKTIGYNGPETDVGFHVWPDQWGGPTSTLNVVPGNGRRIEDGLRNLNNGDYADFERDVSRLAADPANNVEARITLSYAEGNVTTRPDAFNVSYRLNGGEWSVPKQLENKWKQP